MKKIFSFGDRITFKAAMVCAATVIRIYSLTMLTTSTQTHIKKKNFFLHVISKNRNV